MTLHGWTEYEERIAALREQNSALLDQNAALVAFTSHARFCPKRAWTANPCGCGLDSAIASAKREGS